MPANVVKTKRDERLWNEAKAQAAKEGKPKNWRYIMGIYEKMHGKKAEAASAEGKLENLKLKSAKMNKRIKGIAIEKKDVQPIPFGIKARKVKVMVAATPEQKTAGLMGVDKLADDEGMYFPEVSSLWMKNVPIDLDAVFINKEGEVIDIKTMKADDGSNNLPTYMPDKNAEGVAGVLELAGGWCQRNNLKIGDKVTILE